MKFEWRIRRQCPALAQHVDEHRFDGGLVVDQEAGDSASITWES